MPRIQCRPFPLAPVLAAAFLVAVAGCREGTEAPTGPELAPAAATAAAALSFRQVSAGGRHSCGVTTADRAYCWGFNAEGQLGDGTTAARFLPVAVLGGLRFRQVNVGYDHSCGVTTDDRAFCWGRNDRGQLGDGTTADRLTPGAVAGGRLFRQVRAGFLHTCALNLNYAAYCWGWNDTGQLGDGTLTQRLTPVRVLGGLRWNQLSGGGAHTCGVSTENQAYCWGANQNGQLGDGTAMQRLRPALVAGGLFFRQIDAGNGYTCAVTSTENRAYCWGSGVSGQLGNGTTANHATPFAVAGARRFDHVNAGSQHTCGVTLAGRGFCWGWNADGQLGDGTTTTPRLTPVLVGNGLLLAQVSAGVQHTCGVTPDDRAYCWGSNGSGQLGVIPAGQYPSPVQVGSQN